MSFTKEKTNVFANSNKTKNFTFAYRLLKIKRCCSKLLKKTTFYGPVKKIKNSASVTHGSFNKIWNEVLIDPTGKIIS